MTTNVDDEDSNSKVMEKLKSRLEEIDSTLTASEQKSNEESIRVKSENNKLSTKLQNCSLATKLVSLALFLVIVAFSIGEEHNYSNFAKLVFNFSPLDSPWSGFNSKTMQFRINRK